MPVLLYAENQNPKIRGTMMKRLFSAICASALMALGTVSLQAQDKQIVKDGERIEIIGDSITAQQIYSRYMEAYIRACSGLKDVKVFQFGWSGERAPVLPQGWSMTHIRGSRLSSLSASE
jgi:hypothetical protein